VCQAARRELEHQRQMEWDRQRRDQLMLEKQQEQCTVDELSAEVGQLRQELDVLVSCVCGSHLCVCLQALMLFVG